MQILALLVLMLQNLFQEGSNEMGGVGGFFDVVMGSAEPAFVFDVLNGWKKSPDLTLLLSSNNF